MILDVAVLNDVVCMFNTSLDVAVLNDVVSKISTNLDVAVLTAAACLLQGCSRWCCIHCRARSRHCVPDQLYQQHISVKLCQPHISWGGAWGWRGCVP